MYLHTKRDFYYNLEDLRLENRSFCVPWKVHHIKAEKQWKSVKQTEGVWFWGTGTGNY